MNRSEHFSLENWADFVRNVARPESQTAMQRHLEDGCPACTELHDSFRAVNAIVKADAQYEPPASTVRLAKALYSLRKPAGFLARALDTVALLFDSHLAPAAAGVRGGPVQARQLLFSSGDRVIELQVMPSHERARTLVIGQFTAPPQFGRSLGGLPVLLEHGTRQVARTATSQSGEFQMDFDGPIDDLSLTIGAGHDVTVISLRTLTKA